MHSLSNDQTQVTPLTPFVRWTKSSNRNAEVEPKWSLVQILPYTSGKGEKNFTDEYRMKVHSGHYGTLFSQALFQAKMECVHFYK